MAEVIHGHWNLCDLPVVLTTDKSKWTTFLLRYIGQTIAEYNEEGMFSDDTDRIEFNI